ncbi:hypothetical protein PPYR_07363 [Photinus pyralis]|uniref:G-protein coupled receptors family 1 profile domain-containing protein n=1 Tax=Photinus pyralis TaxID=7054 RepID=A0A5N4AQE2_PHOPY|nr:pinopsin-like [Photinus pyralis]KAB0799483.1 hypothetical protein PPYR_07363 [Photinus pyralis]
MNANNTLRSDPEKFGAYVAASVVLSVIGLLGFTLNLIAIKLMWKEKHVWTSVNVILFNLVCADFLVALLGIPMSTAAAIAHKWIFGSIMCTVYGFFMSLLGITAITTLTALSFERYLIIMKPLRNAKLSRSGAWTLLLSIWLYSFVLTTPPLIGWGDYINEAANISCSVNWEEQGFNVKSYIIFLFVFGLVLPLIVIGFSYISIIIRLKQQNLQSGQVKQSEKRVTISIFVMIVAFLTAWMPYAVMALVAQFGAKNSITPAMGVIPAILAKSSVCYNPVIYVAFNTQFRHSWMQMFSKARRRDTGRTTNVTTL